MPEGPSLAELGETALLQRLAVHAPPEQWNDDAALLPPLQGERWVISTDALVEGVHFSAATTPAWSVGWRAAAANLSDLAAMGCQRGAGFTVAVAAPGATPVDWLEQVYAGMGSALTQFGGQLLGGDCSRSDQIMLSITAIGAVNPTQLIRRDGGRCGDWLVVSGAHGLSGLGLRLLQAAAGQRELAPELQHLDPRLQEAAIRAHQEPQPRFDAVAALHASRPQGSPWRLGGTDSSDGLRRSLELLGDACGCRAELDPDQLPLPAGAPRCAAMQQLCLDGGEDFELVLALPEPWAHGLLAELPGARHIGQLGACSGPPCWADTKNPLPGGRGFEHFS